MGFKKHAFISPENIFTPGFFWTWGYKLDKELLFSQLRDMAEHGFKSVCIHPLPKGFRPQAQPSEMEPDYLTDDYMKIYAEVLEYIEKLGMNSWLYDEGGWPSGGACGQVRALNKDKYAPRSYVPGPNGPQLNLAEYAPNIYAPQAALLEDGVAQDFIRLTHERYKAAVSDHFGKAIHYAFTDEPGAPAYYAHRALGWSSDFADEFKKRKGYDITPFIQELLDDETDTREYRQRRVDYLEVRADLLRERFLLPLRDWCRANGLLSGGHFGGEDQMEGNTHYGYGHILRSLRALDLPGIDVIWGQLFPNKDSIPGLPETAHEPYTTPGNSPFPKYASSAAHQNGLKYALAETFAIYADSLSPDTMKWIADYMMVRGINMFVISYYPMKTTGAGMLGGGPHFGKSFTFWDAMPVYCKYVSRTAAMLAQGKPDIRTAVLYDIRAIWAGGKDCKDAIDKNLAVSQALANACCDFDYIDDYQLAEATLAPNNAVRIGKMTYTTVILPTHKWLAPDAAKRVKLLREKGADIVFGTSIQSAKRTAIVTGDKTKSTRVCKRVSGTQTLYFFVNESDKPVNAHITLDERTSIARCDQESAKYIAVDAKNGAFSWSFPPFGSALFITNAPADKTPQKPARRKTRVISDNWTLRKVSSVAAGDTEFVYADYPDEKPVPVELGDWRPALGDEFSGKAAYATTVESPAAQDATLDLGRVCYSAEVTLNGKKLPRKFFGPFIYGIRLRKGVNTLEVTITNTLGNVTAAEHTRKRIYDAFPPPSPYEGRIAVINKMNQESGLFGPVKIAAEKL